MFKKKVKSRKNGPLKALQSVFGGQEDQIGDDRVMGGSQSKSKSSNNKGNHHHHNHHNQKQQHRSKTKDDLAIAASQTKEKMKTNPYATIKMWRPMSMEYNSASFSGSPTEEVYQTFTNFDAFRNQDNSALGVSSEKSGPFHTLNDIDPATGRVPYTGHMHSASPPRQSNPVGHAPHTNNTHDVSNSTRPDRPSQRNGDVSKMNGFVEIPTDYPSDALTNPTPRKVSFNDEVKTSSVPLSNGKQSKTVSFNSSISPSTSRSHIRSPHHIPRQSPPPPPLPSSPPPVSPAPTNKSTSSLTSNLQQSHDTSFQLVSDGATNSVKLVLSHKYDESSMDTAYKDIERLLAELKFTMESLRTSRIDKNPTQLSMCLSELHDETKGFIQEAKLFVSSANNSKAKLVSQLESAIHSLAHLFLHGQACMLMMEMPHQAQHLGFHIIKAANAFKTTISAANAATGRSLNDPQMKYLMRQATNLANLLAALLSAVKQINPL